MKAKKWLKNKQKYIDVEVDDRCECFSQDMEKSVICPGCGKEFNFGDGYCSLEYYTENGIWGLSVCPECYLRERRAQK